MDNYKCLKCGFTDEYSTLPSLPKSFLPPKRCPKCKKGKLIKQFPNKMYGNVDIPGGYDYEWGKKAWKRGKTDKQISDYLVPDPVTKKYKAPY